jgi:6-phosphofructokinase
MNAAVRAVTRTSIFYGREVVGIMTGLLLAVVFQGINRFCLLTQDTILHYLTMAGMFVIAITFIIISLRERADDSN